jgi:acetyltransferase-like isoleucine patch superfamily enzyme
MNTATASSSARPSWRFMRHDGTVIAAAMTLADDGRVLGHQHPNESRWEVRNGTLHLIAQDGRSSTVFDQAEDDRPGHVRLRGRYCLDGATDTWHLLEQNRVDPALADRVPELVGHDEHALYLRASERVQRLLAAQKIFFGRSPRRLGDQDVLAFGRDARIEPYACFPAGLGLCTMGAFSYSESPLDLDLVVGRYCSIAQGVSALRDRHPMEWASTSSITYDFDAAEGYRHFVAAHQDFNGGDFAATEPERRMAPAPRIGHDVWIGQHAMLARGITIGHGAVIAAGAVVTKDVPPYAVVAGVPAKVIRMRFPEPLIDRLLATRWWEFDASVLKRCNYREPWHFVKEVAALPDAQRYRPQPLGADALLAALATQPT